MKHRRIVSCMISLCLLLCGCTQTASQTEQDTLPHLKIGGTSYSPYFYQDVNGEYMGIDVQVAAEACRRIGYEPEFVEISIEERFQALQNGTVDCLWSCLTIDGREDEYLWTQPYLYTQRVVAVRADSDIQSLSDLKDKRVGVQTGSTSEQIVLDGSNSELPEFQQLTSLRSLGEVFTALRKGYVDAILGHESSLKVYTDEYPNEYRFLNMSLRSEALGAAFRKDSGAQEKEVVRKLNQAFEEMREDGTLTQIAKQFDLNVQKNVYGGSSDEETSE